MNEKWLKQWTKYRLPVLHFANLRALNRIGLCNSFSFNLLLVWELPFLFLSAIHWAHALFIATIKQSCYEIFPQSIVKGEDWEGFEEEDGKKKQTHCKLNEN